MIKSLAPALNQVLVSLRPLLEKPKLGSDITAADRDLRLITHLFDKLTEAIELYNPVEIEKLVQALDSALGDDLLGEIVEQLNAYDYDIALSSLHGLAAKIGI